MSHCHRKCRHYRSRTGSWPHSGRRIDPRGEGRAMYKKRLLVIAVEEVSFKGNYDDLRPRFQRFLRRRIHRGRDGGHPFG